MKLEIKVVPNAKRNEMKEGKVYLNAPAVEGKANQALVEFLAEHFHVKRRDVKIVKGIKSRSKVVEIAKN
ncbi:MAG: DUF167 domain-containing protein [Candidatus Margulisiibacteriota bacterium]|nr:DUF167 domain-containing protein [Candidatus Margulisiibacteriota bacterium]